MKPGALPPPGTGIGARPRDCNPSSLEIFVPNETVTDIKECFLYLPDDTVEVTDDGTLPSFELCCHSKCEMKTVGKKF